MKPLKAIVVEDERLPRLSLLQKLEDFREQVEVIDSCDNYDDALKSILKNQPDLLLLDIQLHGRDSMQLLDELRGQRPLPHVIFTTAYTERKYLLNAIKLQAIDYLQKPISKNELAVALAKVPSRDNEETGGKEQGDGRRMSFRTATGRLYLDPADIFLIRADGNYSEMCTSASTEHVLENLVTLEQRLDKTMFQRIDRSNIINVKAVYKVNAKRQTCTLKLADGAMLEVQLSRVATNYLLQLP